MFLFCSLSQVPAGLGLEKGAHWLIRLKRGITIHLPCAAGHCLIQQGSGRLPPVLRQKNARDQRQAEERRPFEGIATDGSGGSAQGVMHQKRRQHGDAGCGPCEHRDLLCVSFHTVNMRPPPSTATPVSLVSEALFRAVSSDRRIEPGTN